MTPSQGREDNIRDNDDDDGKYPTAAATTAAAGLSGSGSARPPHQEPHSFTRHDPAAVNSAASYPLEIHLVPNAPPTTNLLAWRREFRVPPRAPNRPRRRSPAHIPTATSASATAATAATTAVYPRSGDFVDRRWRLCFTVGRLAVCELNALCFRWRRRRRTAPDSAIWEFEEHESQSERVVCFGSGDDSTYRPHRVHPALTQVSPHKRGRMIKCIDAGVIGWSRMRNINI